jgi:hypothetical protein
VKIGHPRLGLSERQPGPDAERLRGAIDGDDGAPSSVAPSDHQRPLSRRSAPRARPTCGRRASTSGTPNGTTPRSERPACAMRAISATGAASLSRGLQPVTANPALLYL